MRMFWKLRATLGHWFGKLVWLAFIIAFILVCIYLRGPLAAVWKSISDAMTFD